LRMHGPFDWRLPANFGFSKPTFPQAHSASRHDDEAKLAVVDFDRVDPLAHTTLQGAALDRTSVLAASLRLLEIGLVNVVLGVGQHPTLARHVPPSLLKTLIWRTEPMRDGCAECTASGWGVPVGDWGLGVGRRKAGGWKEDWVPTGN